MKFELHSIAALLMFALTAVSAWPSEEGLRSGIYEIDVKTVMPHLEENLRYANTQERRCVHHGEESSLFPILKHRSLSGCKLDGPRQHNDTMVFKLICDNPMVATGAARLKTGENAATGELNVKMGGKNMAFSQRIEARWQANCTTGKY